MNYEKRGYCPIKGRKCDFEKPTKELRAVIFKQIYGMDTDTVIDEKTFISFDEFVEWIAQVEVLDGADSIEIGTKLPMFAHVNPKVQGKDIWIAYKTHMRKELEEGDD